MIGKEYSKTLIFVSHASADIRMVRRVRNYLEEKNTTPLLFHLVALTDAEEFWPLIEREIVARNFFLYCESKAAERSSWVQRERRAVELARLKRPKRIGRIRVDRSDIDAQQLDRFLNDTFVFLMYDYSDRKAVEPYSAALAEAGFGVMHSLRDRNMTKQEAREMTEADIEATHKDGWVVFFPSSSLNWTRRQLPLLNKLKGTRLVLVNLGDRFKGLGRPVTAIDGNRENAPVALVNALLTEPV